MCGIIAVMRRVSRRAAPSSDLLAAAAALAEQALGSAIETSTLDTAANALADLDRQLKGAPGLWCLLRDAFAAGALRQRLDALQDIVNAHEQTLDRAAAGGDAATEEHNAALIRLKDALWAVRCDRLRHAESVRDLAGGEVPQPTAAAAFSSIDLALSALDRLEVRGRDSAGVTVIVSGVDPDDERFAMQLARRSEDALFQNGSVRAADGCLDFVYKCAAEIGELGDNVAALRAAMRRDALLQLALREPDCEVTVLGHTRWASVGIISEANAHPLNQEETEDAGGPYVVASLNGDVDNHHELIERSGLTPHAAITTDAKVIPALVSRAMAGGLDLTEAFRRTVATFEGSVAIGAAATREPGKLAFALRGSGQALYVGLTEDTYVVASEPYGVIEECGRYLRMDGETPGDPRNEQSSRGQVVVLDRAAAGDIEGIARIAYDGTALPVKATELASASVTTRDIDRAGYHHFLLKEIHDAPGSLQKTLRGRIVQAGDKLRTALPESSLPKAATRLLSSGNCRRVLVIGQGTAAVAGQAIAAAIGDELSRSGIAVQALPATELSGFALVDDMSDTLIVAISQSGTTTDTTRTVDLVRARGACVLAIVNRRSSDLTDKADGVIYTSDGRDIEMSVASTKAFYAQCAAGQLLALAIARAAGCGDDAREHELLEALLTLPDAMREVLEQDGAITAIAQKVAPPRRYWALVGNGKNRVAAAEIRIKLSELCYKSIACDATEDKKHIDLSSEPMILVCAAGLTGSTADDVSKEVAIYRAHKALPVVIATAGETRFSASATATITVPVVHPALAYIMSTMAGHLFGYRAALAIDELALPMRRMRAAIEATIKVAESADDVLEQLRPQLQAPWLDFRKDLLIGRYNGTLEAATAVRLNSLCNYTLGLCPLDVYALEFGEPGSPGVLVDALTAELTQAIDELTRPVDAIKHQAKTVTVGISRADEALLTAPLVRAVLAAGATRDHLGYRDLRALAGLDSAVTEVLGSTRYRIDGEVEGGNAQIHVIDQRGAASGLRSRTDDNPVLKGTKHLVAMEKLLMVAKGRSDERTVILVPEVERNQAVGITLLHVTFKDQMPASALRGVLGTYRNRYAALADAVTETEPEFDVDLLETMPVVDLLCEPIYSLADRWRHGTLKG